MRGGWNGEKPVTAINIDTLSLAELVKLKENVEIAIVKRRDAEKVETLSKIRALADAAGFTLDELVKPARAPRAVSAEKTDKRSAVEPKYAHPENSGLTWTGRGKAPKWVVEFEATGKSRDELLIAKS